MSSSATAETWRPPARRAPVAPRVLLVDDDPIQRKLCRVQLELAGFTVDTAANAEDALRQVEARAPNAIFSDVLMGDTDGFELCRRIRSDGALAQVPVVLASAHFREDADRALAFRLGANALVTRTPDFRAELDALKLALAAGPANVDADDPSLTKEHQRRTTRQLSSLVARAASSEARYRAYLENAGESITLVDTRGVILEANRHCEELLGHAPGGLLGRHIAEFAAPGHEQANVDEYLKSFGPDSTPMTPIPVIGAGGATLFMEWSNTQLVIDGQEVVICIGRDVTQNVRAAEALRRSEERYRTLLERIPYVVWSCDAERGVDFLSPNFTELTGLTREELYGNNHVWIDRVHPEDRARVVAEYDAFTNGGAPFDVEYRWQHRDGHWIWVHASSSARYVRDGRVRVDGMFADVTRRRDLESELRQSQKMDAIGQLAGGVAHDFNNLLSVIMGNAGFLAEDMGATDPRREEIDGILEAARRAAGLTRQLLAFSRKDVIRSEVLVVDRVIEQTGKMLRRLIGEDVVLSMDGSSADAAVEIDRGQLEQVLLNLVVNARDAMPLGGEIGITSARVQLAEGSHRALRAGAYVSIAVRDQGTGIAPELLARIFEPFFTTKEYGKGTGLGLSTVYGIVQGAGGAVDVASEPGEGTTFTVFLPQQSGTATAEPAVEATPRCGTETILVVEDEPIVRTVMCRILASAGYRVIDAVDAETAAALLADEAVLVDLVLSDVVMPKTSGPSMISALREARPDLKVLYASGYSSHHALRTRAPSEAEHFIQKPFVASTLLAKVRELLG